MSFILPGCDGWKEASGRDDGSDGYAFGDITRTVGRSLRSRLASVDWRGASGRDEGDASYHFGDISRCVARNFTTQFSEGCNADKQKDFHGDIGDAWRMFFAQARACGIEALRNGTISAADVEEQEPYLFLGLPGLAVLELVIRSIDAQEGTLVLASGAVLSRQTLPEGQGSRELFGVVMHAVRELRTAGFCKAQLSRLRHAVLRIEGDTAMEDGTPEAARINCAASVFQRIATDVSQLPFFRAHFLEVLEDMARARTSTP